MPRLVASEGLALAVLPLKIGAWVCRLVRLLQVRKDDHDSDFDVLRQLLNRRSGLALDAEKAYLAESRLQPLVQQLGVAGLGGLVKLLISGWHEDLEREVVEAMTTNETFFFRDRVPFDNFAKSSSRILCRRGRTAGKSGSGAPPARQARNPIRSP